MTRQRESQPRHRASDMQARRRGRGWPVAPEAVSLPQGYSEKSLWDDLLPKAFAAAQAREVTREALLTREREMGLKTMSRRRGAMERERGCAKRTVRACLERGMTDPHEIARIAGCGSSYVYTVRGQMRREEADGAC